MQRGENHVRHVWTRKNREDMEKWAIATSGAFMSSGPSPKKAVEIALLWNWSHGREGGEFKGRRGFFLLRRNAPRMGGGEHRNPKTRGEGNDYPSR